MKITRFEDVEAWQAAREMQKADYEATGMKGFAHDLDRRLICGTVSRIRTSPTPIRNSPGLGL